MNQREIRDARARHAADACTGPTWRSLRADGPTRLRVHILKDVRVARIYERAGNVDRALDHRMRAAGWAGALAYFGPKGAALRKQEAREMAEREAAIAARNTRAMREVTTHLSAHGTQFEIPEATDGEPNLYEGANGVWVVAHIFVPDAKESK